MTHFRLDRLFVPAFVMAAVAGCATGSMQSSPAPTGGASATSAAITAADLRHRLFIYADDSMMGRKAGTDGNMKATAYIAGELQKMGMQPGGENGS